MVHQTGVEGVPGEPCVVSAGVRGGDALVADPDTFVALCRVLEVRTARWHEAGVLDQRSINLIRASLGESRNFEYTDGVLDERRLVETVQYLGDRWERASLSATDPMFSGAYVSMNDWEGWRSDRRVGWSVEWVSQVRAEGVMEEVERLLGWVRAVCGEAGVETGYVHVDSMEDPYGKVAVEPSVGASNWWFREVPGYYWAVLLKAGHLERLGGRDRVAGSAPCEIVEPLDTDDAALLCRLTESPLGMSADGVRAWREFLRPVLPAGHPVGSFRPNRELRRYVFTSQLDPEFSARPMWLFEGPGLPRLRGPIQSGESESWSPPEGLVVWETEELGMDSDEPNGVELWLYPPESIDWDLDGDLLWGTLQAFMRLGPVGLLPGVPGAWSRAFPIREDTDEDFRDIIVLHFVADEATTEASIELLASNIGEFESDGGPLLSRIRVRWGS